VFVAHLSEAPTNWHQIAVYFASLPAADEDAAWSVITVLAGFAMVLGQCAVAAGLFIGTRRPSCESSDQCAQKGTWCAVGDGDRCQFCGNLVPLPLQTDRATGGTLNQPEYEDFAGFNATLVEEVCADPTDYDGRPDWATSATFPKLVKSWCETCVSPIDIRVDPLTIDSLLAANVAAMGSFDWVALVLATFIVALTVVGELKDIELVSLAIRHAGEKLSPGMRFALTLLGGIRRWVFLPTLVMAVPLLVMFKGGE
jgi:hypothetical protein